MKTGRSHTFKQLAIAAARDADVHIEGDPDDVDAQAQSVAKSEDGRLVRDRVWAEYSAMLQDANTYGLADIVTWLKDEWDVGVGMSSVHRDRVREARGQRVNDLVTAKIKAAGEMMQKAGAGSQWETGLSIAGGITLSTLMQYGEESLRELSPGDVIKLLNTMAKLSTAQVQRQIGEAKAELARKLTTQVAAASAKMADKKLSSSQISNIVEAVLGSAG